MPVLPDFRFRKLGDGNSRIVPRFLGIGRRARPGVGRDSADKKSPSSRYSIAKPRRDAGGDGRANSLLKAHWLSVRRNGLPCSADGNFVQERPNPSRCRGRYGGAGRDFPAFREFPSEAGPEKRLPRAGAIPTLTGTAQAQLPQAQLIEGGPT